MAPTPTSGAASVRVQVLEPGGSKAPAQEGAREGVVVPGPGSLPESAASPLTAVGSVTPDWVELEPRGVYGNVGRPLLDIVLILLCAPVVGLLAVPLAMVNWTVYRSWKRVFFRQERVGQRGKRFILYKFRTMWDAEGDEFEAWKDGDEGRVTWFGSMLRKSHLDELPQIINILRGEMTFIGPRPEMIDIHEFACREIPGFERRLVLRPGITGRAQITHGYAGHDAERYREKFEADERYRKHFSLVEDLAILVRTPLWMLTMRGWSENQKPASGDEAGGPGADEPTVVLEPAAPREADGAGDEARPANGWAPARH
jgi:lipopolysaccharide/colanic/teichoic acid biosynthesis glycosyltransferase